MLLTLYTLPPACAVLLPIVIVFPSGMSVDSGVEAKNGRVPLTGDKRVFATGRAVQDDLNDSGAVTAILYTVTAPIFIRAERESNVVVADPKDPTEVEREAIGKAVGAVYVVAVSAHSAPDAASTLDMTLVGSETNKHSDYTDKVRMSDVKQNYAATDSNALPDPAARSNRDTGFDNVLQSAANTLVQRLLQGPLKDYYRSVVPANLQPPSVNLVPLTPPSAAASPPAAAPTRAAQSSLSGGAESVPPATPKAAAANASAPTAQAAPAVPAPGRPALSRTPLTGGAPAPSAPAPSATANDTATATANEDAVKAALGEADALLTSGDGSAAIEILRRKINQFPLDPALRIALARTYLTLHRGGDAASEARRALNVLPDLLPTQEKTLSDILSQAFASNGDSATARSTYVQVVNDQPLHSGWARVALGDLDAADGRTEDAETQYRGALGIEPTNTAAAIGLARLLSARGDFDGALRQLNTLGAANADGSQSRARYEAVTALFDEGLGRIATQMGAKRAAYDAGTMSGATIGSAMTRQIEHINALVTLLKAATPPTGSGEAMEKACKRRLYAATLLAQASTDLAAFIQNADTDAGAQSNLETEECRKELTDAQGR